MENMSAAVKYFSGLSGPSYKFIAKEFDKKLEELGLLKNGLNDAEITVLLTVLTKATLAIRRFQRLLHCVLPETTVKKEHIRTVVVWMLKNYFTEPPKKIIAILQWLIALLENDIADRHAIDIFYHQIYYLIFIEDLARWACKIISILTTPDDITRDRVLKLTNSLRKQDRAHHIQALLGLFKSFRPELVPEYVPTVNLHTAYGRVPSKLSEAINKLLSTRRAGVADPRNEINHQADPELILREDDSLFSESNHPIQKVKRRKKNDELIPPPVYISVGSKQYNNTGGLAVDYFGSVEALTGFQLSVDTPSVTLSMLSSDRGRHVLTFCQSTLQISFSYELRNLLSEVFLKCRRKSRLQQKWQLLHAMAELQDYAHQPVGVVSLFLKDYLHRWEGGLLPKTVLKLMTWLKFNSPRDLQEDYLSPLYTLFFSSPEKIKCAIIRSLAQLFSNLMLTRNFKDQPGFFLHETPQWNAEETYICILRFASYMFGQGFCQAEATEILVPEVLRFYEKVLTAIELTDTELCVLPPIGLLAAVLSSYDTTALSRVCHLLIRCNKLIEQRPNPKTQAYFQEVSHALKQYNAEMRHILRGGEFPAADGIFCKWFKGTKLKKISAKPIVVEVRQHPAIISVVWPMLHRAAAEPHVYGEEVDVLSALRDRLPYIYNYLVKS